MYLDASILIEQVIFIICTLSIERELAKESYFYIFAVEIRTYQNFKKN